MLKNAISVISGTFAALALTIAISSPAFANGSSLADSVRQSLGSHYNSVIVKTDGSRVFLSGAVGTRSEINEVVGKVSRVPGVSIVHESLEAFSGGDS